MPHLEASNITTVSPEKCILTEAQDRDCKTAVRNTFMDLNTDMKKYIKEDCENSKSEIKLRKEGKMGNRNRGKKTTEQTTRNENLGS